MPAFEDKPQAAYETPAKKRSGIKRYVFIGIGILVLLGMGSCVWMFSGLLQASDERSDPSRELVLRIDRDGFLPLDDPLLSSKIAWTGGGMKQLQFYADLVGPIEHAGTPVCNATRKAHTNELSGFFVTCTVPVTYPETPGSTRVTWLKEGDDWKLAGYYIGIDEDPRAAGDDDAEIVVHDGD